MTETATKHFIQDLIMQRVRLTIYDVHTDKEKQELMKQFRRIEKLFGYDVGSWDLIA